MGRPLIGVVVGRREVKVMEHMMRNAAIVVSVVLTVCIVLREVVDLLAP